MLFLFFQLWLTCILVKTLNQSHVFFGFSVKKVRVPRSGIDTNQVPHLTQDTNWKLTNSQLYTTNESQEVSPFQAGDTRHK